MQAAKLAQELILAKPTVDVLIALWPQRRRITNFQSSPDGIVEARLHRPGDILGKSCSTLGAKQASSFSCNRLALVSVANNLLAFVSMRACNKHEWKPAAQAVSQRRFSGPSDLVLVGINHGGGTQVRNGSAFDILSEVQRL